MELWFQTKTLQVFSFITEIWESPLKYLCSLKTSSTWIKVTEKQLQKRPYFQNQTIMTSTTEKHWHCQRWLPNFYCQSNVSKNQDVSLTFLQIKSYKLTGFFHQHFSIYKLYQTALSLRCFDYVEK